VILLDTHALIWWVEDGGKLSQRAAAAIVGHGPALVSPISFWEIAVLVERQRLAVDRDLTRWTRDLLDGGNVQLAELTAFAAVAAARLPDFHGDPADRFIYASARELDVMLVSKDERISAYAQRHGDVEVVW
jgi:PIN domain nuclease of toxin-antitoxin system